MAKRDRVKVIIMGAGGRDFHNFNVFFRGKPEFEVVAFTAGQVPNIAWRIYPPELVGPLYSQGIPIYPEEELERLIKELGVDEVVLSYSDLLCEDILVRMCRVLASGASFRILGVRDTMLRSSKPVIAVTAVRTGAGKTTTSRYIVKLLKRAGLRPVVVRHPMAYGDFNKIRIQRVSSLEELDSKTFTIEEREEFESHVREGTTVYAGVDYEAMLREVEQGLYDVIVWDGGNNDWPFINPDLHITVVDPTRPGNELSFPGLVNLLLADVVVLNKVNLAGDKLVGEAERRVGELNPRARVVKAVSECVVDKPKVLAGRRVLVVEDGPSVTHGHMPYAAGCVAAIEYGAVIVDPRPYAVGSLRKVYEKYQHIGPALPAMGYGEEQMRELEETINRVPAEVVVLGTPTDISRYLKIERQVVRVHYELSVVEGSLEGIVSEFVERMRSEGRLH